MRNVSHRDAFYAPIEHYVSIAAGYGCDFVVLPEMLTFPLAAGVGHDPAATVEALTAETPDFRDRMSAMAVRHSINIAAGSHLTRDAEGVVRNISDLCLRDGSVHSQEKLHPTPDEHEIWGVEGARQLSVVETDCGPVGTLICYDSEFPELGRKLVDDGARLIFVPFQTDTRAGTMRIRLCSQARAIAEAEPNAEQIIFADLDMARLDWARREGAVRNLSDRRPDLYESVWKGM